MERISISNILNLESINDELEFQRASSLYLKMRLLVKGNPGLKPKRKHLGNLISDYEERNWSDIDTISDEQVEESDLVEKLVEAENKFISNRKRLIRQKLKELEINQTDLGEILGHRKGYMSELINGVRPFSKDDIIVLNRLLKISFDDLIPSFIKKEKAKKIKSVLKRIGGDKLKIQSTDLDLQIA